MKDELMLCKEGQGQWSLAFKTQDPISCTQQYTENAVLEASPLGRFSGREQIQVFWKSILDNESIDITYTNIIWKKADEGGYWLCSSWGVNSVLKGIRHERWMVLDGDPHLVEDVFEIQDGTECPIGSVQAQMKELLEGQITGLKAAC